MDVSFSDANLTTRVRAVRNICLVAVLLALPFGADAQQRRAVGRPGHQRAEQSGADERRAERRQSDQRQSDQRQLDRRESGQRQAEPRPATGLGPIGLTPAQTSRLPWWEQRRTPAWEQRQLPAWEQRQTPAWELTNPSRAAQSLYQQPVRSERPDGRVRPHRHQPSVVYLLPPYRYFETGTTLSYGVTAPYVTPPPPYEAPAPPPAPPVETGFLKLEVEPRQALQVFVDGLYIGTLADLGEELELRLGARRIELRAPGYRTLIFNTEIVPDRMIVYRGALELNATAAPSTAAPRTPAADAPQAPALTPGSRTMYVIPGCYMGNVSPKDIKLRPGCDIANLTTITPP